MAEPEPAEVEAYWRRFVAATGIDGPHTAWGFGDSEQMATELGLLVRDGPKRATASLRSVYDGFDTHLQAGLRIEDSAFLETMMSDDGLAAMKAYIAEPYEKRRAWLENPKAPQYKWR